MREGEENFLEKGFPLPLALPLSFQKLFIRGDRGQKNKGAVKLL
jgi:hypothetical protein